MSEILATRVESTEVKEETASAPAGEVTETASDHIEKPLELLDEPYVVELLELGEAYGHFDMENLVKEIDAAIKEELAFKEIEPTREGYKELINAYLKRLDFPEGMSIYARVEKLNKLVSINCKLLQATKEKQEFMSRNPSDMSSAQLRRYISENL